MAQYAAILGERYFALQSYLADTTSVSVPAGRYYPYGYTSESANQLIETMVAGLISVDASTVISYSVTSNKMTISFGSAHSITWGTATALRDALGFSGDLSSSTTHVAPNPPEAIWRPSVGLSGTSVDIDQIFSPRSSSRVVESAGASIYGVTGPIRGGVCSLAWRFLPKSDVVVIAGNTTYSAQALYQDVIRDARRVRYVPDRTSYIAGSYGEAIVRGGEDAIGDFESMANRSQKSWDGLWDVTMTLLEYI